jgi:hypothetical protein
MRILGLSRVVRFALTPEAKSGMLGRIADTFRNLGIHIGTPATDVRIIQRGDLAVTTRAPHIATLPRPNENR